MRHLADVDRVSAELSGKLSFTPQKLEFGEIPGSSMRLSTVNRSDDKAHG